MDSIVGYGASCALGSALALVLIADESDVVAVVAE